MLLCDVSKEQAKCVVRARNDTSLGHKSLAQLKIVCIGRELCDSRPQRETADETIDSNDAVN